MARLAADAPTKGGFSFDLCQRNEMLLKKGMHLPTFRKTGTTIVGLVFQVLMLFSFWWFGIYVHVFRNVNKIWWSDSDHEGTSIYYDFWAHKKSSLLIMVHHWILNFCKEDNLLGSCFLLSIPNKTIPLSSQQSLSEVLAENILNALGLSSNYNILRI